MAAPVIVQQTSTVVSSTYISFPNPLTPGNRVLIVWQNAFTTSQLQSGWTPEFEISGTPNSINPAGVATSSAIGAGTSSNTIQVATVALGAVQAYELANVPATGTIIDAWGYPNGGRIGSSIPAQGTFSQPTVAGYDVTARIDGIVPFTLDELFFCAFFCGPKRSGSQSSAVFFQPITGNSGLPAIVTDYNDNNYPGAFFGTGTQMTVGHAASVNVDIATPWGAQTETQWDDNSAYALYTLPPNAVGFFVKPAVPPAPPVPPFFGPGGLGGSPGGPARGILIIYDFSSGNQNIIQLPQDMLVGSEFNDIVNGGSSDATILLPRRFIEANAPWVSYGDRVQFFLQDGVYPWYDGRIMEFDPEQQDGNELLTIFCEGWSTRLADAIVTESLNPGPQSNGTDNGTIFAGTYLTHVLNTYVDSAEFGLSYLEDIPVDLDAMQWDGAGLDQVIDDVVKNVVDETGAQFEWWVRGTAIGLPAIVIQKQQLPDPTTQVITGRIAPSPGQVIHGYIYEFVNSTIYDYKIQYSARGLTNLIALYGGRDPATQQQVYGPFKDSTSISLYGLREKKVTNSVLLSAQTLANYATVYLLLNGYPQPQGSFKKYNATDAMRAGVYVQIHVPGSFGDELHLEELPVQQQIQQVRSVKVTLSIPDSERLVQTVYTSAPRPYIDQAYYGAVGSAASAQRTDAKASSTSALTNYYLQTVAVWLGNI